MDDRQGDEVPRLLHALESPLRLRLVAELLRLGGETLTLEQAAVCTASPAQDVAACLRPLVAWGVVEEIERDAVWRLGLTSGKLLAALKRSVEDRAEDLARDRHVRHELLGGMVGADPKMQLVTEMVRKVARLDVPVLIVGETGTGKELIARAVHDLSHRKGGFFADVNCATLTESLFESQVFGHARGAFTGAVQAHTGLVERCAGGTLFLDEIGELSLENQVKLLKVLQSGTFTRVGETTVRRSDFRLVSATNRHLPAMIAEGRFREDLFYRIDVFPIILPALRERLDDLPYLVDEIVARNASRIGRVPEPPAISGAALERLRHNSWAGNIRELENVVVRAMIAAGGERIDLPHLPPFDPAPIEAAAPVLRSMAAVERDHITAVLKAVESNVTAAAHVLEMSRTTLYRKMREHGLEVVRTPRRSS